MDINQYDLNKKFMEISLSSEPHMSYIARDIRNVDLAEQTKWDEFRIHKWCKS